MHWWGPLAITSNTKKLDQGYPSTVQLDGDAFLTVWYETPEGTNKAVLKQARLTLAP